MRAHAPKGDTSPMEFAAGMVNAVKAKVNTLSSTRQDPEVNAGLIITHGLNAVAASLLAIADEMRATREERSYRG